MNESSSFSFKAHFVPRTTLQWLYFVSVVLLINRKNISKAKAGQWRLPKSSKPLSNEFIGCFGHPIIVGEVEKVLHPPRTKKSTKTIPKIQNRNPLQMQVATPKRANANFKNPPPDPAGGVKCFSRCVRNTAIGSNAERCTSCEVNVKPTKADSAKKFQADARVLHQGQSF